MRILRRFHLVAIAIALLVLLWPISVTEAAGIWHPTASAPIHWQWQLSQPFNINTNLIPGVTVYDIDGFDNDASVVAALHARGCKVIAYVDFGTWENWRPDASSFPSSVLGNTNGWPGEKWLDIRSDAVKAIMAARLDMVKAKGFDAVEPDCIDGYSNNTGFPLTAQNQISYNTWIATQSHQRGLSVGLKNDVEQATTLQPYFDWALNEECYQYSECNALAVFSHANKAVFQVEYSGTGQCSAMNSMHFNSMARDLNLVSPNTPGYMRVPCIPDTQNIWSSPSSTLPQAPAADGQSEGASSDGGCFIATAAYGTPMAAQVQVLRDFRDRYLVTSSIGEKLVSLYYRVSPPIAQFIDTHPFLKPIVRAALQPAIGIATFVLHTSASEKIAVLALLLLLSSVWLPGYLAEDALKPR